MRDLAEANALTIPTHLARLLYPTYYAGLILPLAEQYGYDPLLQFALVRQESLFESFATSSAVAQVLAGWLKLSTHAPSAVHSSRPGWQASRRRSTWRLMAR